jgi:hypothetical protein
MFDTYQTTHFVLDIFRYGCISDVACNMYVAQAENSVEMFIFAKAGKHPARLVEIISWR